jgi:hypothetical protein
VNRISWGEEIVPKLQRSVCCVMAWRKPVVLATTLFLPRKIALKMSSIALLPLLLTVPFDPPGEVSAALTRRAEEIEHFPVHQTTKK